MDLATAKSRVKVLTDRKQYDSVGPEGPFFRMHDSNINSLLFDAIEALSLCVQDISNRLDQLEK